MDTYKLYAKYEAEKIANLAEITRFEGCVISRGAVKQLH